MNGQDVILGFYFNYGYWKGLKINLFICVTSIILYNRLSVDNWYRVLYSALSHFERTRLNVRARVFIQFSISK